MNIRKIDKKRKFYFKNKIFNKFLLKNHVENLFEIKIEFNNVDFFVFNFSPSLIEAKTWRSRSKSCGINKFHKVENHFFFFFHFFSIFFRLFSIIILGLKNTTCDTNESRRAFEKLDANLPVSWQS